MLSPAWRLTVLAILTTSLIPNSSSHAVGVPAPMEVTVGLIPGGFRVCGYGESDSTSHSWQLTVEGIRSTGGQISASITGGAATFDECTDVMKSWSPAGSFIATIRYVGIGPDLAGFFVGGGSWMSGPPDQHFGSGVS